MHEEILDPIRELISLLVKYELGSNHFYIIILVTVLVWVVVARVLTRVYKSARGLVAALLALAFPLSLGLLAYGLAASQLSPKFDIEWLQLYFPHGVGALVTLLIMLTVSRWILAVDSFSTMMVFIFATAAAVCAYTLTDIIFLTLEEGGQQIKQREERSKETIDSVL